MPNFEPHIHDQSANPVNFGRYSWHKENSHSFSSFGICTRSNWQIGCQFLSGNHSSEYHL